MSIIDTTIPVSLDAELIALLDSLDEFSDIDFDLGDDFDMEPLEDEETYDDFYEDDWEEDYDWDIDPDDDEV